jgi:hypothetical protein
LSDFFPETKMPHTSETTATAEMRSCAKECADCHEICIETVQHCLAMGGEHASPEHIRTLLDCAQICQTSADFLTRASELHLITCAACAEICRACERACEAMGTDQTMKTCAEACARCAESCERMAA